MLFKVLQAEFAEIWLKIKVGSIIQIYKQNQIKQ
jgi:hypothetical protein